MQSRIRALTQRIVDYWTWWRSALLAIGVAGAVLAVVADSALPAVVGVGIAVVPLVVLLALLGGRVADHHGLLSATPAPVSSSAGDVSPATASTAAVAAFVGPGPGDLSILVEAGTISATVALVRQLHDLAPGAECIVGLPPEQAAADAMVRSLVPVMETWTVLRCVAADAAAPGLGDLVDASASRLVLVVDPASPIDPASLAALFGRLPPPDEPWIGRRRSGPHAVVARSAIVELGLDSDGAPTDDQLVAAGYVVDDIDRPVRAGSGRARRGVPDPAAVLERVGAAGRVVLAPLASYHTIELFPLARELAAAGVDSVVVVPEPWIAELAPALVGTDLAVYALPAPGGWLADAAAVVVMNDWDADLGAIVRTAQGYGVPTIAKVEGAQDFDDVDVPIDRQAYRHADLVLCQGQNDVDALAGVATALVGSTRLERIHAAPPRPAPAHPLAVINVNFTFGVLEDACDRFVQTALEGCRLAGIDAVISVHPHQRGDLAGLPLADEPMSRLLHRASVLVSRFSTVPFEAMAAGVPFVYHNPHGERVPTFAGGDGAFEHSTDAASLAAAIEASLPFVGTARDRAAPFFARQVDIDPTTTAERRAAAAVLEAMRER
ncbi:MAG: hypothetical protein ACE367_06195 [Acidimicrobiales bacterium]